MAQMLKLQPQPQETAQGILNILSKAGIYPHTESHDLVKMQSILEQVGIYPNQDRYEKYITPLIRFMSARWVEIKKYMADTIYAIATGRITTYKPLPDLTIKTLAEERLVEAKDFIIPQGQQNLIHQMMIDTFIGYKGQINAFIAQQREIATKDFLAKQGNVATSLQIDKEGFEKMLADLDWQASFVDNVEADTRTRIMSLVQARYPNRTIFKNMVNQEFRVKRDDLIQKFKTATTNHAESIMRRNISPSEFTEYMRHTITARYMGLYAAGKGAKELSIEEQSFIMDQVNTQMPYLQNFQSKIQAEMLAKPLDQDLGAWVRARANLYAERGSAIYEAGWVSALPADVLLTWDMQPAEHCVTCPIYEANSPYTKQTLPGFPGEGFHLTQCGTNCKCKLGLFTPLDYEDLTPQQQFAIATPGEIMPSLAPPAPTRRRGRPRKKPPEPTTFSELDSLELNQFEKGNAKIHGDTDKVENQVFTIRRYKSAIGREHFEVEFRSLDAKLVNEIYRQGAGDDLTLLKKTQTILPEVQSQNYPNSFRYATFHGKKFSVSAMSDLAEHRALRNTIKVNIVGSDIKALKDGLEEFGRHFKLADDFFTIPTEQAKRKMYLRKLYTMFDPKHAYDEGVELLTEGDLEMGIISKLEKEFSKKDIDTILKGYKEYEVNSSYYTLKMPDIVTEKFKEKGGLFLFHSVATEDNLPFILKDGLLSTKERFGRGLLTNGMSSFEDIKTGGADNVFVRIVTKHEDSLDMSPAGKITIDLDELSRTDWYAYNTDRFGTTEISALKGRRNAFDHIKGLTDSYSGDNEIMLRNGISPKAFKHFIAYDEQDRQQIIDKLTRAGITEFNGKPISEFIAVASDFDEYWKEYF